MRACVLVFCGCAQRFVGLQRQFTMNVYMCVKAGTKKLKSI